MAFISNNNNLRNVILKSTQSVNYKKPKTVLNNNVKMEGKLKVKGKTTTTKKMICKSTVECNKSVTCDKDLVIKRNKTVEGTLAVTGATTLTGAATILSPVNYLPTTVTQAEGSALVLTTANAPSGSLIICNCTGAGGSTLALPAATTGYSLTLVQNITGNAGNTNVISCNGTDTLALGGFVAGAIVAAPANTTAADTDTQITLTYGGTNIAWDLGSHIYFNCIATGKWLVRAYQSGKGNCSVLGFAFA